MNGRFPSTNWTLVASAAREPAASASGRGADPLAELCDRYWRPVCAYLRQRGHRAEEAEDLTQGFFVHLLSKRVLQQAQPERGRLRSLILACLTNFVANEQTHTRAQKRGGGIAALRLDGAADGRMPLAEPSDGLTPETIYERQWAITLLRHVLDELRGELARAGKAHVFDALKLYLIGDSGHAGYRHAAEALHTTEGNARVTVHRLRRRYRQILAAEIGRTLHGPSADVEDEIRYLFAVMQRQSRRAS